MRLLWFMIGWHMLADYPLQGEFLATAKNRTKPNPYVPWYQALLAHAVIHGAGVSLVTRSVRLGVIETIIHFIIDDAKCRDKLTYNQDQLLHGLCKVVWWILSKKEMNDA